MLGSLRDMGFEMEESPIPPPSSEIGEDDIVLVAGGDGTLSLAVNLMGERKTGVAVFPGGLFNTFCRTYALPCSAGSIKEAVVKGRRSSVPVGVSSGLVFLSNLSIGYKAEVVKELHAKRTRFMFMSYMRPLVKAWSGLRVRRLFLRCDGAEVETVDTPLLCVAPDREGERPFLRLYIVEKEGRWSFLLPALAVFLSLPVRRKISLSGLRCGKATELEIDGDVGAVNLDGEIYDTGPMKLEAGMSGIEVIGLDPSSPPRHRLLLR